ncbi:hypothetical protein Tco_0500851 [Tanacetum coccineum]
MNCLRDSYGMLETLEKAKLELLGIYCVDPRIRVVWALNLSKGGSKGHDGKRATEGWRMGWVRGVSRGSRNPSWLVLSSALTFTVVWVFGSRAPAVGATAAGGMWGVEPRRALPPPPRFRYLLLWEGALLWSPGLGRGPCPPGVCGIGAACMSGLTGIVLVVYSSE